ncbi:separin protein [Vanrija albida]|uniref:separase n=1 Tax=Vanrija albida TaxID=181172 RepID=A0ABR3PYA3_9TREE
MPTKAVPREPASAPRTTRTRRAAPAAAAAPVDALAADLDRVLKVSQPKVPVRKASKPAAAKPAAPKEKEKVEKAVKAPAAVRRPAAASTSTSAAGRPAPAPAPKAPAAADAKRAASRSTTTTVRSGSTAASAKSAPAPEPLPWEVAGGLSSRERAQAAQAASNGALRELSAAVAEGSKASNPGKWGARVAAALESGGKGVAVLRELYAGLAGAQRVAVERGAMALVVKCLSMEMYDDALSMLADARPFVLRLYEHGADDWARPAKFGDGWAGLAAFPAPKAGSPLDEGVRTLLCSFALAAWNCFVSVKAFSVETIAALLPLPRESDALSPVLLAPSLPVAAVGPLAVLLYRRLAALTSPPGSAAWLHARTLSAFTTAVAASAADEARKNPPDNVWQSVTRTVQRHLEKKEPARMRQAAGVIATVVGVVERICEARSEDRAAWFSGSWSLVADAWVGIGRNLGDSSIIDSALAALAGSTTLEGSSASSWSSGSTSPQASTPLTSTPPTPTQSPIPKVANAGAELKRLTAQLSKTLVDVEAITKADEGSDNDLATAVGRVNIDKLLAAICSLDSSDASATASSAAARAVERLRRVVVKLLDTPKFASASKQWIVELFGMTERLLLANDSAALARDCMPGAVDSTLNLIRQSSADATFILRLLDRTNSVYVEGGAHLAPATRLQLGSCLAGAAHSSAVTAARTNKAAALPLAQRTCEWSLALLALDPSEGSADRDPALHAVEATLPKRYELLAFCLQESDREESLKALCQSLASIDPATIKSIAVGAATKPIAAIFSGLPDVTATLKRCTAFMTGGTEFDASKAAGFLAEAMAARGVPPTVHAAIVESIAEGIEHADFRPHIQDTLVALTDSLFGVYDAAAYPVRRMRVASRFMSIITSTGVAAEQFDNLADEVDALAAQKTLGKDSALAPYREEYRVSALILRSISAYHTLAAPTEQVVELSTSALGAVRALVVPPIKESKYPAALGKRPAAARTTRSASAGTGKAAAAKAPARAVSRGKTAPPETKNEAPPAAATLDSVDRLAQLLNTLSSLCGILGQPLLKLETLKVLHALLRPAEGAADAYIQTSAHLATEYGRLGKTSRATHVFNQAIKFVSESPAPVSAATQTELHLRHSRFLAISGHVKHARDEYIQAEGTSQDIPPPTANGTYAARWISLCDVSERVALAHAAVAAIKMAEENVTNAIASLTIAYRQWCRAAHGIAHLASAAPEQEQSEQSAPSSPTEARSASASPTKKPESKAKHSFAFTNKHLGGLQWHYAEALFDTTFELALALARRGSIKECEYYLQQARYMAPTVRSSIYTSRVESHSAEVESRKLRFEHSAEHLQQAIDALAIEDGVDAVNLMRVKGELLSKQQEPGEADELFLAAVESLTGLDNEFGASEARMPMSRRGSISAFKEPLFPVALGHVLRQRAWLLREAGCIEEYEAVLQQLDLVPKGPGSKPEQLTLEARVAMHEAFSHFKTDLFMSSLTESTIAMTMGSPDKRAKERQSNRHSAQVLLERACHAFRQAVTVTGHTGRVEDVRQACVSLALLGAFQTSVGHGSPTTTSSAADLLASISTITLQRELIPAIDSKFVNPEADDMDWPHLAMEPVTSATDEATASLRAYWNNVRSKHATSDVLSTTFDLNLLPADWAVVSITVTNDRNTMLVSRHQRGTEPIVFCIPLDRQGRREGEDETELFTFDAGVAELKTIMDGNVASIKSIKDCKTMDDRKVWWKQRLELDERLGQLLASIEFCWLGAFKTVLNPRRNISPEASTAFRDRLNHIFQTALSSAGSDMRRGASVRLNDTLLSCFATLSSKCKDEEIEDLVYFVLDLYQFHGIAVALAELDFDQIGVDVKGALADLETAIGGLGDNATSGEHLLLALDKNVQGIPWESIPILRGRAVSRIPSLPFLFDQVALGRHLGGAASRRTFNPAKTRYFLNPSGDLTATQGRFEARLTALEAKGWSGVTARVPTEGEMVSALGESDLVMYFGHGGGEEYIRGHKVRALRRCAVTMLWGCSSGLLREHGDFDCTGTPWDYVLAGSPCLVANLWDVTDKDIDRITEHVMDGLGLAADAIGQKKDERVSVVQAVSAARATPKLQYLTGAAPVVYGIPVYLS